MVTQWNVSLVKEKIKMKGLEDLMVKRYQGVSDAGDARKLLFSIIYVC